MTGAVSSRSDLRRSLGWSRRAVNALPMYLLPLPYFWQTRQMLRRLEYASEEVAREYQLVRLRSVVDWAYQHVPWYREAYSAVGYEAGDLRRIEDVLGLPCITKRDVREQFERFIADSYAPWRVKYVQTSGSSGQPLGVLYEYLKTDMIESAFVHDLWARVGYRPGDKVLFVEDSDPDDGNKGIWKPYRRLVDFSTRAVSPETVRSMIAQVSRRRIRFMVAFPSSAVAVARVVRAEGLAFPRLDALLLSSEVLYPHQRALLKETFECAVYNLYGQVERVVIAGTCEDSERLHVSPWYGFTELLEPGTVTPVPSGAPGEIVGTGFFNRAMPLIRYRTGDMAAEAGSACSCGRPGRIWWQVEGRLQDYLVSRTGRAFTVVNLKPNWRFFDGVLAFRYRQDTPGVVDLEIELTQGVRSIDDEALRREIEAQLGEDFTVNVVHRDSIGLTGAGKLSSVDQQLDVSAYIRTRPTVPPRSDDTC